MTVEIAIVFGLVLLALILFAWERVSYDVTALIVCATLLVTGILTPEEGLSGFSNPATITIGAMFVLSEGLRRTGALDRVGDLFVALGDRNRWLALGVMMLLVGVMSGFINNTAAIAIFIPIVLAVSKDLETSPSKLLMPLSFASMLGGVCTLIGTSTNILVGSLAQDHGLPGFGMFELLPMGLVFFVVGFAYLGLLGVRMTPARRAIEELTEGFAMREYLTDVLIEAGARVDEEEVLADDLLEDLDLDLIAVFSPDGERYEPRKTRLRPGMVIRVRGSAQEIQKVLDRMNLALRPTRRWSDEDLSVRGQTLVEAVVAPDSELVGRGIAEIDFVERFEAVVLAVRQSGRLRQDNLGARRLSGGDSLLLSVESERVHDLAADPSFVVVSELDPQEKRRRGRLPVALLVLAAVVGLAAFDVMPIVASAVAGCVVLLLTGTVRPAEAYSAINWKVIFLLAGVIPLGAAMDRTGASELISSLYTDALGPMGPYAVLAGFFGLSMFLTNVISNQATAALLAPIAIEAAGALHIDARPLLMAVTYAASLSFMTPVGYQTNTLVYGPGNYEFLDYTKVGTPLNLIFWLIATFAIPWFWPF